MPRIRRVFRLNVILILLAAVLGHHFTVFVAHGEGGPPQYIFWTPDGQQVLCSYWEEGDYRYFSLEVETQVLRDPFPLDGALYNTAPSPDGRRIAMMAHVSDADERDDLFVSDMDGGSPINLTAQFAGRVDRYSWSPDSTRIAIGIYDERVDIYVVNLGDLTSINVTEGVIGDPFIFEWSPDSSRIAIEVNQANSDTSDLYVVDADGGNLDNLTRQHSGQLSRFQWSPDSAQIALAMYVPEHERFSVVIANGTTLTAVSGNLNVAELISWLPDSTGFVYTALTTALTDSATMAAFVVQVDDGTATNLSAPFPGHVVEAKVSPDGRRIALTIHAPDSEIYAVSLVDIDGSNPMSLSPMLDASARNLGWSPNSARLAFVAWDFLSGDNPEVYVANVDGSDLRKVAEMPTYYGTPFAWSPDGQQLAVNHRNSGLEVVTIDSETSVMYTP